MCASVIGLQIRPLNLEVPIFSHVYYAEDVDLEVFISNITWNFNFSRMKDY